MLAKYLFYDATKMTFEDFLVFWSKIQFLCRKNPFFGDFWPFLVIFGFELMPAGASLCTLVEKLEFLTGAQCPKKKSTFFHTPYGTFESEKIKFFHVFTNKNKILQVDLKSASKIRSFIREDFSKTKIFAKNFFFGKSDPEKYFWILQKNIFFSRKARTKNPRG